MLKLYSASSAGIQTLLSLPGLFYRTWTGFFTFFVNAYKGMAMMIGLYCRATVDVAAVLHRVSWWRAIISWEVTVAKLLRNKRSLSL